MSCLILLGSREACQIYGLIAEYRWAKEETLLTGFLEEDHKISLPGEGRDPS